MCRGAISFSAPKPTWKALTLRRKSRSGARRRILWHHAAIYLDKSNLDLFGTLRGRLATPSTARSSMRSAAWLTATLRHGFLRSLSRCVSMPYWLQHVRNGRFLATCWRRCRAQVQSGIVKAEYQYLNLGQDSHW